MLVRLAAAAEQERRQLGTAGEPDRGALRREQQREHKRKRVTIGQVAHEVADENRYDEAGDHAEKAAQKVGQRSAGQPEVERSPATEHVRRAQVGKYQSFQCGQPDDDVSGVWVPHAADQEITEHETTDHSEPRPQPPGEKLGTLHGLPPQETDTSVPAMNAPDLIGLENAPQTASASVRTSMTSRPECRPAFAPAGIKARVSPCRAASWRRHSSCPTRSTSPVNPSSPITTRPSGNGPLLLLLAI